MQRVHGPHLASSLVEELYSLPGPLVTTIKVIPGLPQDTSSCLWARPMRSRRDGRRERHASSPEKQLCRAPFVPMSCDSSSADDEGTCKLPLRAKLWHPLENTGATGVYLWKSGRWGRFLLKGTASEWRLSCSDAVTAMFLAYVGVTNLHTSDSGRADQTWRRPCDSSVTHGQEDMKRRR